MSNGDLPEIRKMGSWQENLFSHRERFSHLLRTGDISDVTFVVGVAPDQEEFKLHKVILSMCSDVFCAMVYTQSAEEDAIYVTDVEPDVFRAMMKYVYNESFSVESVEEAAHLYDGAVKYKLVQLQKLCMSYINEHLSEENISSVYRVPNLLKENHLKSKCETILSKVSPCVLKTDSFIKCPFLMVADMVQLNILDMEEEELFNFALQWAKNWCLVTPKATLRLLVAVLLPHIRFLSMSLESFLRGPGLSGVLTDSEVVSISANLLIPCSRKLPSWCSRRRQRTRTDSVFTYRHFKLFQKHTCNLRGSLIDTIVCDITVVKGCLELRGFSICCKWSEERFPSISVSVWRSSERLILCNQCSCSIASDILRVMLLRPIWLEADEFSKGYTAYVRSNSGRIFQSCNSNFFSNFKERIGNYETEVILKPAERYVQSDCTHTVRNNSHFQEIIFA